MEAHYVTGRFSKSVMDPRLANRNLFSGLILVESVRWVRKVEPRMSIGLCDWPLAQSMINGDVWKISGYPLDGRVSRNGAPIPGALLAHGL